VYDVRNTVTGLASSAVEPYVTREIVCSLVRRIQTVLLPRDTIGWNGMTGLPRFVVAGYEPRAGHMLAEGHHLQSLDTISQNPFNYLRDARW
jgi:hypothetical protein